ncbi:flagellar basal-body MS-ring/collar protein FliF [Thalassobacillus sp. CUG 92003]|uniref:flagellar basal-body MS-ring/collar protein FliF n=1 Tax=Thalassobacillus sp. CUG 92003 TaxID=2736641 RepID=UPI0015E63D6A|nr:flagellar basal-body MS-ring/collar protein FliF [Thalassobacillus sp. CUG 92003]
MKEKISRYKEQVVSFWRERSRAQKGIMIGSVLALILILVTASIFASSKNMVPLYRDLSLQEVGQIKEELDTRGVKYELTDGGSTVTVPEENVEDLLVDLAALGLPESGSIDYSFFSANTSWGMTDKEFEVIELDAMQSELSNLISGIDGIQDAKVMINRPEEPVFMGDQEEEASASIVLNTQPGYQFENNQIKSLYNLVAKSMPNLPTDNIVLMDQNFEYYDLENSNQSANEGTYTYQQNVKENVERDIQQRLQQMLGRMIGRDKIVASVTADIDFTQENRTEKLVEPVDPDSMEGLPVSVERIEEAYTGTPPVGGETGTGDEDTPNYPAEGEGNNGDYEMEKETINNEFDRIRREIVESPYKVRDLGVQIAIDNTKGTDENGDVEYLSEQEQQTVQESAESIVNSMISTSISGEYDEVEPEEKTSIVFQEFNGNPEFDNESQPRVPLWMYIAGGILLLLIGILAWLLFRKRSKATDEEAYVEEYIERPVEVETPELEENESESTVRRKQLERMAKDKPEEFAKLLRSWISEE